MKEFTFEEVKDMIDNLEPKINEMTIEEVNTMVINDVKIMNYIQKFMPLDFNYVINFLIIPDITIAFNSDMIYGKDGILLNKVPLTPDDINHLKKEFKGKYYSKTRIVSFRANINKNVYYYVISIDGNMYDVTNSDNVNTIILEPSTKNRIISAYMLYHNMLHNWIESNIHNLDIHIKRREEKRYTSGMVILTWTTNKDNYIGIFDDNNFESILLKIFATSDSNNYIKDMEYTIKTNSITNISCIKVDDINMTKEYLMKFRWIDFDPDKAINNFTPLNMENCYIGDIIAYIKSKEKEFNDTCEKISKAIDDVNKSVIEVNGEKLYNVAKVSKLIYEIQSSSKSCVDDFLDRTSSDKKACKSEDSSDKHTNETKNFNFGMVYKMYGMKTVKVPKDFTLEQAKQYVQEHLDDIDLPRNADYVSGSDEPDFDICDFDECW